MIMTDSKHNTGLTHEQVEESRRIHGPNILTPPAKTPLWKLYIEKYQDPMIRILLVAAVISLLLAFVQHDYLETIGIFVAIFFATTVGFYFECDASKKFDVLNAIGEEQPVKVRRNGKVREVARKDIVVGDIVLLEVGDEIPADGTLLSSLNMQVDESSLTGESLTTKNALQTETSNGEAYAANHVLRSTMVMNGRGEMIVTRVGDATEIGKVARKSTEDTNVKTPLSLQLDRLGKMISIFGFTFSTVAGIAFFIVGASTADWNLTTIEWVQLALRNFMLAVTLIVMAVPEGLPMAITLALALNMRRMLKSNNLVRKLHACETMGAVNIICTDKTGTLTQNRMAVGAMDIVDGDAEWLARCISLNSTAHVEDDGQSVGNPTEAALLRWVQDSGFNYHQMRRADKIISQQPFSTELKYMSTTVLINGKETYIVKGAPEVVMDMCDISNEDRDKLNRRLAEYQNKAMRTLAFAVDGKIQAIAAISDPIREDVPDAVKDCLDAGISIKVVTGDTSATAIEIARQIGVINENDDEDENDDENENGNGGRVVHITGAKFASLSDEEAENVAKSLIVMSRARPTDKQRLVQILQKLGNIVAVTGDGTNDAPALNYAHVGLSLGSGTSVAKQASDMTLIDDSFGSIASAVMWGRSLFRNIQRFLFFQLVVNVAALLLVIGGACIGKEMPLTVTQILWVNLIMDTFAAMALASLAPSKSVMKDEPRNQKAFIISKKMFGYILFWGVTFAISMLCLLFYYEHKDTGGYVDAHELTKFFTVFVMLQFWNLFNAKALYSGESALKGFGRKGGNRGFLLVLMMILVGQILIVTFGGEMFRTNPLSIAEWTKITLSTSVVLWIGEVWRYLKHTRKSHTDTPSPTDGAVYAATVGFFDGVHKGHQYVLARLVHDARDHGMQSLVVTFRQHPRQVLQKDFIPKLLSPYKDKKHLLAQTGVDKIEGLTFTKEFASLSAREFMQLLHDTYNVRRLLIGYDNRFGRNRSETFEDYVRIGKEIGIEVVCLDALGSNGQNISSSLVRRLLAEGDIAEANINLAHEFGFEGTVVRGFGEGRKLGFPTANMKIAQEQLIPKRGVYAVRVRIDGYDKEFAGMMNIGCRPTYGEFGETVEVNILDFDADIYDRRISVRFIDRIRDEKRFSSIDELRTQISHDKEQIRKIMQ